MSRPDTRVRIAFDLAAGGAGNFFTLDDPSKGVLDGPVRTNLSENPSFETNVTGWQNSTGNATGFPQRSTAEFLFGAAVLVMKRTTSAGAVAVRTANAESPAAVQGETFTVSAYIKPLTAQRNCRVQILARDSGFGAVTTFNGPQTSVPVGVWTRISHTATMTNANTAFIYVVAQALTCDAGDEFAFDGVLVEKVDTLGDYFDGDVLDASGVSYTLEWTGTANNSTSTATPNAGLGLAGDILEDVTAEVRSVSVRRGRSRELERFQAGAATVTLDNSQRKYDPAAGTAITPYGASMRPRKAVQISSNGAAIFTGVVDDWDLDYSLNGDHVASVKVTDGFVFLAQQEIEPHTASSQTTGARIAAILDRAEIAWPEGKREIDTGVATLQADSIGGTADAKPVPALAYLQQVDTAEQGALFIGKGGALTFRSRSSLQILTEVAFTDDGTGIPFTDIAAAFGSEELRNRITVTRLNGGTATASGTASIAEYGAIDFELRDVLLADDTQAQSLADVILARFQEPILRIDSVEVVLNNLTTAQQAQVLDLDLGSLVQVTYTPSGIGDPIDQFVAVDAIEHSIDAQVHRMRFNFSQGEAPALVLDSLLYGVLDTNTLGF